MQSCCSSVKRTCTIKSVDTARLFELEGKPNLVTLHFHFTIWCSPSWSNSHRCCDIVFTAEVKKKKKGSASLLGHGKLINGQNTAVEIQLVTVFMEPLPVTPTQTSLVWVYQPQRRP